MCSLILGGLGNPGGPDPRVSGGYHFLLFSLCFLIFSVILGGLGSLGGSQSQLRVSFSLIFFVFPYVFTDFGWSGQPGADPKVN